jgi:hypothetical protein
VPTKWTIAFGPAIQLPPAETDATDTLELAENVRETLDRMIAELLASRRSILFG